MRRIHVEQLRVGDVALSAEQSHHLRTVLRASIGDPVELFTAAGAIAQGRVTALLPDVVVAVEAVVRSTAGRSLTIAAAVPKGDRAEWMIEKLSEIGVSRFVPLRTARSVVHPEGAGKLDRWRRIAIESAKQSRRPGVMQIEPLSPLGDILRQCEIPGFYFSTGQAQPLQRLMPPNRPQLLLIGPEGGWTPEEEARMAAAGLTAASLGSTILRVETAAILSAGLVMLLDPDTSHP